MIEVDPVRLVEAAPGNLGGLAYRLWLLDREALRSKLARLGIPVARWAEGVELNAALEGVRTFRRYARLARG